MFASIFFRTLLVQSVLRSFSDSKYWILLPTYPHSTQNGLRNHSSKPCSTTTFASCFRFIFWTPSLHIFCKFVTDSGPQFCFSNVFWIYFSNLLSGCLFFNLFLGLGTFHFQKATFHHEKIYSCLKSTFANELKKYDFWFPLGALLASFSITVSA